MPARCQKYNSTQLAQYMLINNHISFCCASLSINRLKSHEENISVTYEVIMYPLVIRMTSNDIKEHTKNKVCVFAAFQ